MIRLIVTSLLVLVLWSDLTAGAPTWLVDPSDYSGSMVMVGVFNYEGQESADANDQIAAFIDGEVRGVANLQYEAAAHRYYAYLIVYSNASSGEITFEMYDAESDQVIDALNTQDFSLNASIGNLQSPIVWSDEVLNEESKMTSFSFKELDSYDIVGNGISVTVPYATNIEELIAEFTISAGASATVEGLKQVSGTTANDYSSLVTYVVTSEDGKNQSEYQVSVTRLNNAPTELVITSSEVEENSALNTQIGSLVVTDDDSDHEYSFASGEGDDDNEAFEISGDKLIVNSELDFETKGEYSIRVKVVDGAGQSIERVIKIDVMDLNETPTDMSIDKNDFSEHAALLEVVGALSVEDEDTTDSYTYTLLADTLDNALFSVEGNELKVNSIYDYESDSKYSVVVQVEDEGGNTLIESFDLSVIDANDAPSLITLDKLEIFENSPFGTTVGNIAGSDQDADDALTFALVSGSGDTDNEKMLISGQKLVLASAIDFESQQKLEIRLQVEDLAGATFERAFEIEVLNTNDAPTALTLSNDSISEGDVTGYLVGRFDVADVDSTSTTFSFIEGQNANQYFQISGDSLMLISPVDFEVKDEYVIDVLATDSDSLTILNRFVIRAHDINEAPANLALSVLEISENNEINHMIGLVSASDPDLSDSLTYSIIEGDEHFVLDQNILRANESFDFEGDSLHTLVLEVVDLGGLSLRDTFRISVIDQNESPMILNSPGPFTKTEESDLVIDLSGIFQDVDAGDQVMLSVSLDGEALPAGVVFNQEEGLITINEFVEVSSLELLVTATDRSGLSVSITIEVSVDLVMAVGDELRLSIFPNPTTDFVQMSGFQGGAVRLELFDQNGRSQPINQDNDILDMRSLPLGLYFLRIEDAGDVQTFKVVKK